MSVTVGLIGFGEASHALAKGFHQAAAAGEAPRVIAYARRRDDARVQAQAAETGVTLTGSIADLVQQADHVFSVVVSASAVAVAQEAAPRLRPGQFFADMNSASPMVKEAVAATVKPTGARPLDVAIMGQVPRFLHRVPLLLGGPDAEAFQQLITPWGMVSEIAGDQIGAASAIKMMRSVMMKGSIALITECLNGAAAYGVGQRVLDSVSESTGFDWTAFADNMVPRQTFHAIRREREMLDVCDTLEAAGVEPFMSRAAADQLAALAETGVHRAFGEEMSPDAASAITALRARQAMKKAG